MNPRQKYREYQRSQRNNMKDYIRKDGCLLCGCKHRPLEIHHHWDLPLTNPDGIRRSYRSMSINQCAIELAKCVPLCVHCHLKVHRSDAWQQINKRYSVDEIYRSRYGFEVGE